MNRLSRDKQVAVIAALVEGNSLRATARMTDVARMTVEKLLRDLGTACARCHDEKVRHLESKRIQCDEIWSFIGAKAKNVPEVKRGEWGDCWTWTALDADSKLMVSYMVGPRSPAMAYAFMSDVAARLNQRVQLTTDGLRLYLNAVEAAFGDGVDYAMLEKHYGADQPGQSAAVRYSPARITHTQRASVSGNPNPRHISTSYVERQNLTMRMHMRRFTRLTNGFSKKVENHAHSVALHFMYYNFVRIHQSLRVTPAMEAGVSDHAWSIEEVIKLMDFSAVAKATA